MQQIMFPAKPQKKKEKKAWYKLSLALHININLSLF